MDHERGAPATLGPLLAALRTARGWSQLGLAERLCAAAGMPTITRHEVSRWERERRVPGEFWLGWLALVLETPLDHLVAAAAETAREPVARRSATPRGGDRPAGGPATGTRRALVALAHRWLTDAGCLDPVPMPIVDIDPDAAIAELAELRRLDDLVGGVDLAPFGRRRLASLGSPGGSSTSGPSGPTGARLGSWATPVDTAGAGGGRPRAGRCSGSTTRRRLRLAAEAAQLTGWLSADAGDASGALADYRRALTLAAAAGDRLLGGYVLSCGSHLLSGSDPATAMRLAWIGYAGLRSAPAGLRAVQLHRLAVTAALAGRHRLARSALAAADRAAAAHLPDRNPSWLYWLDDTVLAALTGRCLAVLGRPSRAEPMLAAAACRPGSPRTRALYGAWWAGVLLDLGEVEQACAVADETLLEAVRSGSVRATTALTAVRARLTAYRNEPVVRRFLATAATAFLPTGRPVPAGEARWRAGGRGPAGADSVRG
ncbi:transcriptional regulator [Plantactinospora sp. GCM10030261]|uniref:transcriptional regulator n=1 Tax=Plantactinospora sp. GCM10030261 TaxID=3273420 RepID=UPI0036065146